MNRLFSVPSERKLRKMLRSEKPLLERNMSLPSIAVKEESIVEDWPPALTEERTFFLLERVEDLGGLKTRGIFRVSGDSPKINEVVYALASNDRSMVPMDPEAIHDVACALKQYVNMQDVPLCTFEEYDNFIAVASEKVADVSTEQVARLKEVLARLPPLHCRIMHMCVRFLQMVSSDEHRHLTCMNRTNCGIVFGPVFFRPMEFTAEYVFNVGKQCQLVEIMIAHADALFGPAAKETATATPATATPGGATPGDATAADSPLETATTAGAAGASGHPGMGERASSSSRLRAATAAAKAAKAKAEAAIAEAAAAQAAAAAAAAAEEEKAHSDEDVVVMDTAADMDGNLEEDMAASPYGAAAEGTEKHKFKKTHFSLFAPVGCRRCGKLIWGLRPRGYVCQICNFPYHKQCMKRLEKEGEMCPGEINKPIGKPVAVGDVCPNIVMTDHNNAEFNLHKLLGEGYNICLFFYPKSFTPGCVVENKLFRDYFRVFFYANFKVVGISSDSGACHNRFAEKYNLPFQLLSDKSQTVRKSFGVPSQFNGLSPGRVTYIISNTGKVKFIHNSQLNPEEHIIYSLKAISKLLIEVNYCFD